MNLQEMVKKKKSTSETPLAQALPKRRRHPSPLKRRADLRAATADFDCEGADGSSTQVLKMHRFLLVMIIMMSLLAVRAAAQPRCDPLTQYALNGECCRMCGPGTSMTSLGTCLEPQCRPCNSNEYQDEYTMESKCQRQPYCDPNRNFKVAVHENIKKTTCMCQDGFHCSAEECITCVSHSTCEPGHGVKSKGNHTHDTVCQECHKGTFSDENSFDGVCKKWTECEDGYHIQQRGTEISDNICVKTSRTHEYVLIAVFLAIGVVLVVGLLFKFCKGQLGSGEGNLKGCIESCLGDKKEPVIEREARVLITTPTDHVEEVEESTLPEGQSSQEEGFPRTPVENEDDLSQENSAEVILTDKGNFVTQENGKAEKLSRQESQTQTLTD